MRQRVESVLDRIRPHLQSDGADVQLLGVSDDGVVTLRLIGGCTACPMSKVVIVAGIESALKSEVPGVSRVELLR